MATGKTVVVGCKLPHGLHLEHKGTRVTLNGTHSSRVLNGHGITHVDAELFEKWLAEHNDYAPVKAGLIFAHEKEDNTRAEAKEKKNNKSGLEPLDPEKPGEGLKPEKYEGMKEEA